MNEPFCLKFLLIITLRRDGPAFKCLDRIWCPCCLWNGKEWNFKKFIFVKKKFTSFFYLEIDERIEDASVEISQYRHDGVVFWWFSIVYFDWVSFFGICLFVKNIFCPDFPCATHFQSIVAFVKFVDERVWRQKILVKRPQNTETRAST